jgi:hypothetical protein
MTVALCNSCLRVRKFPSYKDACEANCECGAENGDYVSSAYCPCPSCAGLAEKLLIAEGNKDAVREVFYSTAFEGAPPESFTWSSADGFVSQD